MKYLFFLSLSVVSSVIGRNQEELLSVEMHSIADLLKSNDLHYTIEDQEIDGQRIAVAIDIRDNRVNSLRGLQQVPEIGTCKELSIRFTQVPVIGEHDFKGLSQLKRLSITNNPILHAVQPGSFIPLRQLQYLNLSYNPALVQLRQEIFEGLSSLQELDISSGHLKWLHADWFKGLDNLEVIYTKALGNLLIQKIYKDLNNDAMVAKRGFKVKIIRRFYDL